MFKKQSLLLLTMVGLAVSVGGCAPSAPTPTSVAPDMLNDTSEPLSSAPAPAVGSILGVVFNESSPKQPVRAALVTAGGVSTSTASPQASAFERDVDNNKTVAHVLKDFGDGNTHFVERRLRKQPIGPAWSDKYVYLKAGEFFLEGVPEGTAIITATVDGMTSKATMVVVPKNDTRTDIKIPLFIPGMVCCDDDTPQTAEAIGVEPESALKWSPQNVPDPSVLTVRMHAPASSRGTVIKGVRMRYSWDTAENLKSETNPPDHPIGPFVVAPAQDLRSGPVTHLSIPIGSPAFQQSLARAMAMAHLSDSTNELTLTLQFIDENGFEVLDPSLNPLMVSIPIERR